MMRRLLTTLLLLLLTARLCAAAIGAGAVWEVRPTSGLDANGGCYDSSISGAATDYASTNTVHMNVTDINHTGGSTTITSATGGFTGTEGNCIHMNSGTNITTGWYMITVVTDTNTATVDRSMGASTSTNGAGKVGGAVATMTTGFASGVAGNTVWIKNEAWNEAISGQPNGTAAAPIVVHGYNTSRGDTPTGTNRPRNNRAGAGSTAYTPGSNTLIQDIWVSNAGGSCFSLTSTAVTLSNVRASTCGATGIVISNGAVLLNSELDASVGVGVSITGGTGVHVHGCIIHGNAGGVSISSVGPALTSNLIYANTSHGIAIGSGSPLILNNTIDGNTGASTDGINATTPTAGTLVLNNTLTTNGRYGFNCTNCNSVLADYNDYNGNSTAARNNAPTGPHDITSAPGYTNSGGGNYQPASGSALINAGFPGTFPASTSVSKLDIGAAQSGIGAATQRAFGCVQ